MSYTSNRTLLEKADLALADLTAGGGILLPAQAQKFMRLLIKQSVLMQLATVVPMASPKHQLSKIKFGSRILRPGQEATALAAADRARPDLSFLELDARLFKAEVHLSDEVLEDNIERGELRQTILEMIAEAAGRDMEEVIINGDTASADPFLATMDGLLKQTTSHVVDAAGVAHQQEPAARPAQVAAERVPARQEADGLPHQRRRRARLPQHAGRPRHRRAATASSRRTRRRCTRACR